MIHMAVGALLGGVPARARRALAEVNELEVVEVAPVLLVAEGKPPDAARHAEAAHAALQNDHEGLGALVAV